MKLPYHLGGHLNKTHIDKSSLSYFINNFQIKSFLDIGCGPGGMVQHALSLGLKATGIDGDFTLEKADWRITHDFTKGPIIIEKADLGWSVEFLEHVEKEYQSNYMSAFSQCNYVFITHALPNKKGHHHVNLEQDSYWIEVFENYNFIFLKKETEEIRRASSMRREFVRSTGLVFKNKNDYK